MKAWRIKILTGPSSGKYLPVEVGFTIGRKRAKFNLNDPKASSIHAVIKKTRSGKIVLVDNNSRNGTKVNGEKRKQILLHPGVKFQIGSSKCEVIDFQKYLKQRAGESSIERYNQSTNSFVPDFHGDELQFGSTDASEVDSTELDKSSAEHSSADVNVLDDKSVGNSQFYQDAEDAGKQISATPKLNIKKFEEKRRDSPNENTEKVDFSFQQSQINSSPFAANINESSEAKDVTFDDMIGTSPSIRKFNRDPSDSEINLSNSDVSLSPAEKLDRTMVLEIAQGTNENIPIEEEVIDAALNSIQKGSVNKEPFDDLVEEVLGDSSIEPAENVPNTGGADAEEPLTKTEEIPKANENKNNLIKSTPQNKVFSADEYSSREELKPAPKTLEQAIENIEGIVENQPRPMEPLVPGIRLVFIQGPQVNTAWTIGYGPREIGPESSEFPIIEQNIPDICFLLKPTSQGVMFETSNPHTVLLNNKSIKSDILKSGDVIRIGDSAIEVETF
ncbi:MAG: FHA domain-containing protein [Bdellovibrionales bacterium]